MNITEFFKKVPGALERRVRSKAKKLLKQIDKSELENKIITRGIKNYLNFNIENYRKDVIGYMTKLNSGSPYKFRYSEYSTKETIYASMYVCLLNSLFGELDKQEEDFKAYWADYFNSFQSAEDGFFYDDAINTPFYNETDWWGKRHLVPHLIMAYVALGHTPKHQFKWVAEYYTHEAIDKLMSEAEWETAIMDDTDIDNKIMNIGVTLQYQRDYFNDKQAKDAIAYLKEKLLSKINPETSMWGYYDLSDPKQKARMVQFSYHLFRLFFYDGDTVDNAERIIDLIIETQNEYGGFAATLNSGACADIDAIDPLVYLSKQTDYRHDDIEKVLRRAFIFVLSNQNDDGGFVFFRDSEFAYGDRQTSSRNNESALFPTWFRTLSIAYICDFLQIEGFNLVKSPGY